jgi:cytochrome c biogenesis protein CcmG/thiol:disulfide interchange protein DsbE
MDEGEVDRVIGERFSSFRADDWHPDMQRGLIMLRERRGEATGRRRRAALVAAIAIAAVLPMAALPVTQAFAARCVSACVQETAAVRRLLLGEDAEPKPSSTFIALNNRKAAPDFTLTDAAGQAVRLSDFRGKAVLLNFWATWCSPCATEIPWFVEFQRANERRGFTVLGVSMDADGWSVVKPYLERKKVNYPVMLGNENVAESFGVGDPQPIPLTIVIDRSGRIAAVHAGLCRRDEYESDINLVLNER